MNLIVGAIFQPKLTISLFWTKFAQLKTEKMNIAIEFCIFELPWVSNFTFNFGTNLSKKGISGLKQK